MSGNRNLRLGTIEKSRSSLASKEERKRKSEERKQMKERIEKEMQLLEQQRLLLLEDRNRETIQQKNEVLTNSEEDEYEEEGETGFKDDNNGQEWNDEEENENIEEEESVEEEELEYNIYMSQEIKDIEALLLQKQKERKKLCSDGDVSAILKIDERQRKKLLSESDITRMSKLSDVGSFENCKVGEIEETDSVLIDKSEDVDKGYTLGDRFSYEQDLTRVELARKRDIMKKIRQDETTKREKIMSETMYEQQGETDDDIEKSLAEEIRKCEEDTEKAKRHLSDIKLKKERKLVERQKPVEKHVTFPDTPDTIKKVLKERYSDINETDSIYDQRSKEMKSEEPFRNTRRVLYQDDLNDNEEIENYFRKYPTDTKTVDYERERNRKQGFDRGLIRQRNTQYTDINEPVISNATQERDKRNKRTVQSEATYSSNTEHRDAMQKMKSRSRELEEIKRNQELELKKLVEQKKQLEIQRQRKLEEEAYLQESIEELELKEKEIELNQLKTSKMKMEIAAIRKDDECMEKNLKILRLRRSALFERIQVKENPRDAVSEEKLKKPEPKIESGITKQGNVFVGKPFIPAFDGKNFEDWKIEVDCLIKSKMYPEPLLTQGIRASLKGNTRRSLHSLNPSATSAELVEKLEEVYGSLKESDALMQDFYSSKQNPSESTSDWGVRVENLFQKLVRKGEIDTSQRNTMLKRKFWRGLYNDKLREAMRVSHESTDTFEILRQKTRKEEEEMDSDSKVEYRNETEKSSKTHQPIRTTESTKESKLDTVLNRIEALETEIRELRSRDKGEGFRDRGGFSRGRSRFRGGRGDYRGAPRGRGGRDDSKQRESKREPLEEKMKNPNQEKTNPEKSEKKKDQLNQ